MTLEEVLANLDRTIEAKEKYLAKTQEEFKVANKDVRFALYATIEFVKVNLEELRNIRADLESCVP